MATQQGHDDPRKSFQKQVNRTRFLIAVIALMLIIGGAIFWLVDTPGSLYAVLPIIIFTVLGAMIALFQWLFPISNNSPGAAPSLMHQGDSSSAAPSLMQQGAAVLIPVSASQFVMPAPPIEQRLPQTGPLDKATYRGIRGVPPLTDARTIQQREAAVQEVYAKLCASGVTALVLTGIGGVGKSTLAALVYQYAEARRLAGEGPFPAEALWLHIDPAVTLADLAGNLFEVFGKPLPDFTTLSLQHQAMALFNVLNTAPRLIVLDQFENLLDWQSGHALADRPGVGEWVDAINSMACACRVLLTSRPWPLGTREYPPTYMHEYFVKGLEPGEGIELLRKLRVEGSDEELSGVVARCQGHAQALTLFAALLHSRNLSLGAFFSSPIYTQIWTGNVARNLLDCIYQQQLNEEQRGILQAFSVYREPVPLEAVQALVDENNALPRTRLQLALDALLNQHLLQASGEGAYQVHALVRSYAYSRFDSEDEQQGAQARNQAHLKAAQYYIAHAALVCPPREKRRQISDVQPFIEAAWQYCQAERWPDAFSLMDRESVFVTLKRAGGNAILLELYQLLLDNRWKPSPRQRARIFNSLGVIYRMLGRMEKARDYLEQSLQIYQERADREGEALVLNDLGRVYADMGNRERARADYEASLRIFQEQGDQQGEGSALNNLGWVFVGLGQDKQAQEYYEQALKIFRGMQDRLGEAATLNNLGRVYEDLGEIEQAKTYYEQALGIFRDESDKRGEAWSLNNLGKACKKLGDYDTSIQHLRQALSVRRAIDRKGEGRTLKNIGSVYELLGQKQQALAYYKQSLSVAREVEDREGEGKTLRNLGKLFLDLRRYDVALASLLLAGNILEGVLSTYSDEYERGMETLRETMGEQAFAAMRANVAPQASSIVERMLYETA